MKPHMTNPRARRLIRHGEARLKRSVKRETVPFAVNPDKPYLSQHDLASGRCTVRDRFGHRCAARRCATLRVSSRRGAGPRFAPLLF